MSLIETDEEKSNFEKLYHLYKYTMFYVASGILKDIHLAEDAVHEAFIRVAKNLHKINDVDSPQTKYYMITIVKNVSLSMLKETPRNTVIIDDTILNARQLIEDNAFEEFDIEAIVAEILKLPDIYKDVLYLECVNEFRIKDIAKALEITNEAAKKRSQRGKKILIQNLINEGVYDEKKRNRGFEASHVRGSKN